MLEDRLNNILRNAIAAYDFPRVTYDFSAGREIAHPSMREVERTIRHQLTADDPSIIKDGLANVLYWGYARVGYRRLRVNRFRDSVTDSDLKRAGDAFRSLEHAGVHEIARLGLPEFSGLSFVSKIRMFLSPCRYVVLDRQILKLREQVCRTPVHELAFSAKETSIRVSKPNERVYERWSRLCQEIAQQSFPETDVRAVDVERGIFTLIQQEKIGIAAEIVRCN